MARELTLLALDGRVHSKHDSLLGSVQSVRVQDAAGVQPLAHRARAAVNSSKDPIELACKKPLAPAPETVKVRLPSEREALGQRACMGASGALDRLAVLARDTEEETHAERASRRAWPQVERQRLATARGQTQDI